MLSNKAEYGGGLFGEQSLITISNGLIDDNSARVNGGGVYSNVANTVISGGVISNNKANNGAGVCFNNSPTTIDNAEIVNNVAVNNGGGFYSYGSSVIVKNTLYTQNTAVLGKGYYSDVCSDVVVYGSLQLIKTDVATGLKLVGAEFELFKLDEDNNEIIVDGLIDNNDGTFSFTELEKGIYYVRETKAPIGFVLNSTPVKIELVDCSKVTTTITNVLYVAPRGSIVLTKTDVSGTIKLVGANFDLLKDNVKVGTLIDEGNGTYSISNLLFGKYQIKETKSPTGYNLSADVLDVDVNSTTAIQVLFKNTKTPIVIVEENPKSESPKEIIDTVIEKTEETEKPIIEITKKPVIPTETDETKTITPQPIESTPVVESPVVTPAVVEEVTSTVAPQKSKYTFVKEGDVYLVIDEDGNPLGYVKTPNMSDEEILENLTPKGPSVPVKPNPKTGDTDNSMLLIAPTLLSFALLVATRMKLSEDK